MVNRTCLVTIIIFLFGVSCGVEIKHFAYLILRSGAMEVLYLNRCAEQKESQVHDGQTR